MNGGYFEAVKLSQENLDQKPMFEIVLTPQKMKTILVTSGPNGPHGEMRTEKKVVQDKKWRERQKRSYAALLKERDQLEGLFSMLATYSVLRENLVNCLKAYEKKYPDAAISEFDPILIDDE